MKSGRRMNDMSMQHRTSLANGAFFFLLASNYLVQTARESFLSPGEGPTLVTFSALISLGVGGIMSLPIVSNSSSESIRVSFLLMLWALVLLFSSITWSVTFSLLYPAWQRCSVLPFFGA